MPERDFLWLHVRELPYFRALVRAVEARFYQDLDLPAPLLDLGCGDGNFAELTFERRLDVGIDPWGGPLRKAQSSGVYRLLIQGDAGRMPFPDASFASAFSNSVLEHIPHVEQVLAETARVLRPGAPFVFCVPNQRFTPSLSVARALDKLGLGGLAGAYRRFFNRISRHQHTDSPEVWAARLAAAGFEIVRWWDYISPAGLRLVEWGHYFGLPSWLVHAVTRHWLLAPMPWNLALTMRLLKPHYDQPVSPEGVYTFYVARRIRN